MFEASQRETREVSEREEVDKEAEVVDGPSSKTKTTRT